MIGKLEVVKLCLLSYGEIKKIYMEMAGSSKMLVITHKITSCHNPEDKPSHYHEDIKIQKLHRTPAICWPSMGTTSKKSENVKDNVITLGM